MKHVTVHHASMKRPQLDGNSFYLDYTRVKQFLFGYSY